MNELFCIRQLPHLTKDDIVEPIEKFIDCDNIHCDGYMFSCDSYNFDITPSHLAEFLMRYSQWHGENIRLLTSHVGKYKYGAAYQLAQFLGVEVMAPTQSLYINHGTGEMYIIDSGIQELIHYIQDDDIALSEEYQSDKWITFSPEKHYKGNDRIQMKQTVLIYQENSNNPILPSVTELPRKKLPDEEKELILSYIADQTKITWRTYDVPLTDAFSGAKLNAWDNLFEDETYNWTDDMVEYFRLYDIQLPDEFIEHVKAQMTKEENCV